MYSRNFSTLRITLNIHILFSPNIVPPHIIGDGIHDLTVKKGRPIRYDLWFGGEPAPNVEWIRDGRTLGADDNMSIDLYLCIHTLSQCTLKMLLQIYFSSKLGPH